MNLRNKVSLITGGARIGREVARQLAIRGSHLVLIYQHSRSAAEETKKIVESCERRAILIHADLTKSSDVSRAIRKTASVFRRLDVLIHMASIYERTPFERLNRKIWDRNIAVHLKSTYELLSASSRLMRKHGEGRVITFSDWTSASGRPRYKGFLPYHASKTGILGLTQSFALELAPEILVNTIAPGPILPPKSIRKEVLEEVKRATPLKRWGGAEEIAKAVLFLIESDFVTGECIRVDGGRHLY